MTRDTTCTVFLPLSFLHSLLMNLFLSHVMSDTIHPFSSSESLIPSLDSFISCSVFVVVSTSFHSESCLLEVTEQDKREMSVEFTGFLSHRFIHSVSREREMRDEGIQ